LEISWEGRGRIVATIDNRKVVIPGETFLDHKPDYLIYAKYLTKWEDGTDITIERRREIIAAVVSEAEKRGWRFEVEE
jgi:hypothetical protein